VLADFLATGIYPNAHRAIDLPIDVRRPMAYWPEGPAWVPLNAAGAASHHFATVDSRRLLVLGRVSRKPAANMRRPATTNMRYLHLSPHGLTVTVHPVHCRFSFGGPACAAYAIPLPGPKAALWGASQNNRVLRGLHRYGPCQLSCHRAQYFRSALCTPRRDGFGSGQQGKRGTRS
jgi:hypothetical protein